MDLSASPRLVLYCPAVNPGSAWSHMHKVLPLYFQSDISVIFGQDVLELQVLLSHREVR